MRCREEAAIRVYGVSGAATKNRIEPVLSSVSLYASSVFWLSFCDGIGGSPTGYLLACCLPTASFKASPSETRPQGLQASVAASLGLRRGAERER